MLKNIIVEREIWKLVNRIGQRGKRRREVERGKRKGKD
jgi:hypothetical protein